MKNTLIAPLALLASITLLTSCTDRDDKSVTLPTTPTTTVKVETPTTNTSGLSVVAPLTRKETLSYNTPEGMVPVEFDVTVTDGIITAAAAASKADKETSKGYQDAFVKEVSSKVVGKKAKDLKVDAIGGASLTTAAFETFVHGF